MKHSALILVAGTVASVLSACNPPAPPPPVQTSGGPGTAAAQVCTNTNGTLALSNVPFLSPPFTASANQTPTAAKTPINSNVQSDLAAAFSVAPAPFKTALCGLDGIFIDPTGCAPPAGPNSYDPTTCSLTDGQIANNSWGLRTYPPNASPGKRYIALSLGLWNSGAHAPLLGMYETSRLRAELTALSPNAGQDTLAPSYDNVDPNTPAMTVLAALGHEFGHVLWVDTFVLHPGDPTTTNTTTFCNGNFYGSGNSFRWGNQGPGVPTRRWIAFGQQPPQSFVNEVQGDLSAASPQKPQGFRFAGDVLDAILSGPWVSILAAFSPVENFVEAYQLHVLLNATTPLQHLELTIIGSPPGPGSADRAYKRDLPAVVKNPNNSGLIVTKQVNCF